jgi:hypothetical protein
MANVGSITVTSRWAAVLGEEGSLQLHRSDLAEPFR